MNQKGLFLKSSGFIFIFLDNIGINLNSIFDPLQLSHDSSAEDIYLVRSNEDFKSNQKVRVHEKAHYYTYFGSTLFTRYYIGFSELAHQLNHEKRRHLRPFNQYLQLNPVTQEQKDLIFWVHEYIKDYFFHQIMCNGRKIESDNFCMKVGNIINAYFNAWEWGIEDYRKISNQKHYKSLSVHNLMEGIGKISEWIYGLKNTYSNALFSRKKIEEEISKIERRGKIGGLNQYNNSFYYFLNLIPFKNIDLISYLSAFTLISDIALSPPIRTDGNWPTIPSKEFSIYEVLPQTRFQIIVENLSRSNYSSVLQNRERLFFHINNIFLELGWQSPLITYKLNYEMLSNPEKNDLFYNFFMKFGNSHFRNVFDPYSLPKIPESLEESVLRYFDYKAEAFMQFKNFAKAKMEVPWFCAPPVDNEVIRKYILNARNLIELDDNLVLPPNLALSITLLESLPAKIKWLFEHKDDSFIFNDSKKFHPLIKFLIGNSLKELKIDNCKCFHKGSAKCIFCETNQKYI